MKKRKPPIILATILLIFCAAAFGLNYKAGINPKAEAAEQKAEPTPEAHVGNTRAPTSPADVANQVKQQSGDALASTAPYKPKREMMMKGPMANMPSIEMPADSGAKPKPSDTAPSSEWYKPTSERSTH
jgi:hypothetical protein